MRSRSTVAGALGVALVSAFTILGPTAVAATNPCGAGYTLRETMPIDKMDTVIGRTVRSKPVRSIGTIKTYSLGAAKCVFLSVNPAWGRVSEITEITVYLIWGSGGDEFKKVTAYPQDWKGRTSPSVGPVKATVKNSYASVVADVWLDKSVATSTRYVPRQLVSEYF
ncbi:hypothetical protein [Nonomuraea jabiensis]|uniref:hypothetical protein n=1 Tax=Nonomuraea jabiensis TaxID=882448 RepID=UPI003D7558B3